MSLEQFITKLLNLKESDLQDLVSLEKPDESIEFKLKLKPKPTVCPLCGSVVKIHGYYSRKLTHSTFANVPYRTRQKQLTTQFQLLQMPE